MLFDRLFRYWSQRALRPQQTSLDLNAESVVRSSHELQKNVNGLSYVGRALAIRFEQFSLTFKEREGHTEFWPHGPNIFHLSLCFRRATESLREPTSRQNKFCRTWNDTKICRETQAFFRKLHIDKLRLKFLHKMHFRASANKIFKTQTTHSTSQ